jgi:hypothetical protein
VIGDEEGLWSRRYQHLALVEADGDSERFTVVPKSRERLSTTAPSPHAV